jgi:hypothetical protein
LARIQYKFIGDLKKLITPRQSVFDSATRIRWVSQLDMILPAHPSRPRHNKVLEVYFNDARTGMPPGIPGGAMCVQRFDDSLNSAIHTTYRISLRSSSMREPRDPLLKVLFFIFYFFLYF